MMFGKLPKLQMQVLKLLQANNIDLPFKLGQCLGSGADGVTFELDEQRVLKLSVLFNWDDLYDQKIGQITKVFDYMLSNECKAFCKVYDFEILGRYSRSLLNDVNIQQEYILYFYEMEKLTKISEEESKVFHTILSHEDRGLDKKYTLRLLENTLNGLSYSLDFEIHKVLEFYNNLQSSKIEHLDIHPRNIMKNKNGQFFMIDFDRCALKE